LNLNQFCVVCLCDLSLKHTKLKIKWCNPRPECMHSYVEQWWCVNEWQKIFEGNLTQWLTVFLKAHNKKQVSNLRRAVLLIDGQQKKVWVKNCHKNKPKCNRKKKEEDIISYHPFPFSTLFKVTIDVFFFLFLFYLISKH